MERNKKYMFIRNKKRITENMEVDRKVSKTDVTLTVVMDSMDKAPEVRKEIRKAARKIHHSTGKRVGYRIYIQNTINSIKK